METFKCDICGKSFTGIICFQQHVVSLKHKKKVQYLNGNFETEKQVNCSICKVSFIGLDNYQKHVNSLNHAINVQKKNNGFQIPEQSQAVESVSLSGPTKTIPQRESFRFQPYQRTNDTAFECDDCIKTFTGPVPYQQHLNSKGHHKKIKTANLSKELAATRSLPPPGSILEDSSIGDEQSNIDDLKDWYCGICEKYCSGPISFKTHLIGRDHSKKSTCKVIDDNLNKIKISGPFPYVGNTESNSDSYNEIALHTSTLLSESKSERGESSVTCRINDFKNIKNDTAISSDKFQINKNELPNLNIIRSEILDIVVFKPDDEIVFSNTNKCRQE